MYNTKSTVPLSWTCRTIGGILSPLCLIRGLLYLAITQPLTHVSMLSSSIIATYYRLYFLSQRPVSGIYRCGLWAISRYRIFNYGIVTDRSQPEHKSKAAIPMSWTCPTVGGTLSLKRLISGLPYVVTTASTIL